MNSLDKSEATECLIMQAMNESEEIFRITADGDVIVNEKYNVTEAAQAFWEMVREINPLKDKGEKDE